MEEKKYVLQGDYKNGFRLITENIEDIIKAINRELPDDKMVVMGRIEKDRFTHKSLNIKHHSIGRIADNGDENVYNLSPTEQETFRRKVKALCEIERQRKNTVPDIKDIAARLNKLEKTFYSMTEKE